MEQSQRRTTARGRSQLVFNEPVVEIHKGDITGTMMAEASPSDVISALDEVKNLWLRGDVDYTAVAPVPSDREFYNIYTPEKGEGHADPSVEKRIDTLKANFRRLNFEIVGVFIDTVSFPEDPYDIRIAKVVYVHNPT